MAIGQLRPSPRSRMLLRGAPRGADDGCGAVALDAAKAYLGCISSEQARAVLDAGPDLARCDDRLARRLERAACGTAEDAAALGARLLAALEPAAAATSDEAHYAPVIMTVLAPPQPVLGSDARSHLVYEIQLTNASPFDWQIEAIEVLDGDDPEEVLLTVEADEVAAKVQSLADGSALSLLPAGHSALAFLHLPLEPGTDLPSHVVHRLPLSMPGACRKGCVSSPDCRRMRRSSRRWAATLRSAIRRRWC
jgi:hypothetical protein